jgi:hypothetical protein
MEIKLIEILHDGKKLTYYDTFRASVYLGCSEQTVHKLRSKEKILESCGQVGQTYLYEQKALDDCYKKIKATEEKAYYVN